MRVTFDGSEAASTIRDGFSLPFLVSFPGNRLVRDRIARVITARVGGNHSILGETGDGKLKKNLINLRRRREMLDCNEPLVCHENQTVLTGSRRIRSFPSGEAESRKTSPSPGRNVSAWCMPIKPCCCGKRRPPRQLSPARIMILIWYNSCHFATGNFFLCWSSLPGLEAVICFPENFSPTFSLLLNAPENSFHFTNSTFTLPPDLRPAGIPAGNLHFSSKSAGVNDTKWSLSTALAPDRTGPHDRGGGRLRSAPTITLSSFRSAHFQSNYLILIIRTGHATLSVPE